LRLRSATAISPATALSEEVEGRADRVGDRIGRTTFFGCGWRTVKGNEAATMLGLFKTFISNLVVGSEPQTQFEDKARLAAAALLIRVATVDSEMSAVKRKRLHDILKSGFGLDDLATAQLIYDAIPAERSAIDLYQFTRQINEALDAEGRRPIIK
jgi:uncharacterized tellurite resistance protein B-like protein